MPSARELWVASSSARAMTRAAAAAVSRGSTTVGLQRGIHAGSRRDGHAAAPQQLLERYAAPHLLFSAKPLDLARTAGEADAAVTYAGMSTAASFLWRGKPLLLLPGHLEQFLLARRIEEMGAGLLVNPEQPSTDLELRLRRILFEPEFALNAQAFARKYANFPQDTVIAHLIARIEEIAGV